MLHLHQRRPAVHHEHASGAGVARFAFIVNVGDSAFWTILPLQLAALAGSDGPVGYYYALIAALGVGVAILSAKAFRRYRKVVVGTVSLVVMVALLVAMATADDLFLFALFDIPRSMAFMLVTIVMGLLVKDLAIEANLAMEEGRFYQYSNVGWLVGPVMGGYIAAAFGNEAVFIVVAGVFAVALAYLRHLHLNVHPALADRDMSDLAETPTHKLREFWSVDGLKKALSFSLGLEFWWIISSIYIPLAVFDLGFGAEVVGWVVAGGVVPLVLLETAVGRRATQYGNRRYLIAGFLILSAGAVSFIALGSLPIPLLVMFVVVNVGAALVEPLKETYFFQMVREQTPDDQEALFGVYNATIPFASLVGPLLGGVVFTIGLGLNGVWGVTAVAMLACGLIAVTVKEKSVPSG